MARDARLQGRDLRRRPRLRRCIQAGLWLSGPYQAAESAAAVHVYADAFKRAQSLDPEKVRDAIAATELDTFYGPVKFDEAGRNIAKPMVLTQVRHGKYVVVAPAQWATDKPIIPRPPR